MMKIACVFSVLLLLASVGVYAQGPDPEAVLATWDGGRVTVADYMHWWERLSPDTRPELATQEEKADFLDNVVNAGIMLQVARAQGVDKHPNVTTFMQSRRGNLLKEQLFQDATEGRIQVDENQVRSMYEKRRTQISANHIIVPTHKQAQAIMDSLAAGVPFEDLARRYSTCTSAANGGKLGLVRWGDFTDTWSEVAFGLEPGEYSQPFEVEDGYAIIKVDDKKILEPDDARQEEAVIRDMLLRQATFEERAAFLDSLRLAYGLFVDMDALVDLCARFAQTIMDLGITSKVVSDDIAPPLTESEKTLRLAGFKGHVYDYADIVNMILSQPYVVRPVLDDPDQMLGFINRQLNDSLLVTEAEHRGIDKIPEIRDELEKAEQNRTISRFYRQMVLDLDIPDDSLRAFYDAHREAYVALPGHLASKIVVETAEAADSILSLVKAGASFSDIARQRSIDAFTAPQGGDMGFYQVGKDPEFDGFWSQMKDGDIAVFRSVEGHVVLWLRATQEGGEPVPFEDARMNVQRDVATLYKQQYFEKWMANERRSLNLKVNDALLADVDVK